MAKTKTIKKKGKVGRIVLIVILVVIIAILGAGIYLLRSFTAPPTQDGIHSDSTIVQTDKGQLQGRVNNGIYNFLGVEYAKGTKLFQPAEEVEAWTGVKTAFEFGPASTQSSFLGGFGDLISGAEYSNDCQNINIWTPELGGNEKRPVMVWLHGGGFATGSAQSSSAYMGENLAKKHNVVVVGVNHRLNVLGHFDLSAYGEQYKYSANVGIDDIVKSLQWIERNISAFGGDPDNVTLFGQSGGGAKILALMTTPHAKDLFDKVIIQSGATETVGVKFTDKEASQAVTEKMLAALNITKENISDIEDVAYSRLTSVGSDAMAEVAEQFKIPGPFGGYAMEWEPVVDGDYMPTHALLEDGFAENGKDIPMLIGSTLEEWAMMPSEQHEVTPALEEAFKKAYPNEDPALASRADTLIRMPMLKVMSKKADQNAGNVYSYLYTYGNSMHGAEIAYTFANGEGVMNDTMSSIWANFAKTGVPSAEGLEPWEAYTRENGACMILDEECYMAYHHDKELLELLEPNFVY